MSIHSGADSAFTAVTTATTTNHNVASTTTTTTTTTYQDALEDVHTRFILNLPESELQTADRILFQLEQAWWFYEDCMCDEHPEWNLPRFATFKPFAQVLFEYSPLLPPISQFPAMWYQFSQYKRKISNYGCILLNDACTHVVLCQVWNGKSYTFPSGKINQGEEGASAAARETYEETGFDPAAKFGLTASWKQTIPENITWPVMQEKDALVFTEDNGKRRTLYVVAGVPEHFPFCPVARKEVSTVTWHSLDDIPKPNYAVMPFLGPLRKWIRKHKRRTSSKSRDRSNARSANSSEASDDDHYHYHHHQTTTPNRERGPRKQRSNSNRSNNSTPNREKTPNSRNNSRQGSRGRVIRPDDDLVTAGLAQAGEVSGWSEEDMFTVNEKLIGRPVEYDGNPHVFAEKGFGGGQDPHAFRVVGGSFLNSGIQSLAPPPERSKLQPLFRTASSGEVDDNDANALTPFFSDDGVTPWGEIVQEAQRDHTPAQQRKGSKKKKSKKANSNKVAEESLLLSLLQPSSTAINADNYTTCSGTNNDPQSLDTLIMTDREITAKSQAVKSKSAVHYHEKFEELKRQADRDEEYIRQWAANLPKPRPTKMFGDFKLDIDKIMIQVEEIMIRNTGLAFHAKA